jgi:hypothetical protein
MDRWDDAFSATAILSDEAHASDMNSEPTGNSNLAILAINGQQSSNFVFRAWQVAVTAEAMRHRFCSSQ